MSVEMLSFKKISGVSSQFEGIKRAEFTKKRIQKLGLGLSSSSAYDFLSGCIVYEMACLRCNYRFKADLNNASVSYNNNLCCPYCGREDQLRIQKGRLI